MQIRPQDELVNYIVKRKGWGSHQTVLRPFSHHPSHSLSKRLLLWSTKDKKKKGGGGRGGGAGGHKKPANIHPGLVLQVSIYIFQLLDIKSIRVGPL